MLEIERLAEHEPVRARQSIKAALEAEIVTLRPSADGSHLVAEYGLEPVQLATGTVSMNVVAGARYCEWKKDGSRSSCDKPSALPL